MYNIGNTNNMRRTDTRRRVIHPTILEYGWHKNVLVMISTRTHTFFICIILAKVKLIWIAARTEAKRGIGFYSRVYDNI